MKIKQIDLIGFKSFAEKASFPLHNGITCIVGPNGCGKSNIVDAFRWVLGEQSAKTLRGDKMEEVIFQGSATKKPKAMAEVSLEILLYPNSDTKSNGDDKEPDKIILTRRLYRSGESEYLINKKSCRLKDIRDILLDTGLDVKSYSILDQQRISDIVNSKPHERRFLIEEIAGVMKYKVRKAEAESKLETSKQNLIRINDLLSERKKQVVSLERQAKRAERYKKLNSQLSELDIKINKAKHNKTKEELSGLENILQLKKIEETSKNAEISTLQNEIQKTRLEIAETQRLQDSIAQRLQSDERLLSSYEKKIAILKTNIQNRETEIHKLKQQLNSNETKREESLQRLQSLQDQIVQTQTSFQEVTSNEEKQNQIITDLNKKLSQKEETSERMRKEMFKISDTLSNKKNEHHKRLSHMDNLDYKEEISTRDKDALTNTINSIQENIKNNELALKTKQERFEKLKTEKGNAISIISSLTKQIDDLRTNVNLQRQSLAADTSRLQSIKELVLQTHELVYTDGLTDKKLSDVIHVDKQYENAVESVLNESLEALLIENSEDIVRIVDEVNQKNIKRTHILYVSPKYNTNNVEIMQEGMRLADIVSVDAEEMLTNQIKNIMSRFYLVEDIKRAFELFETCKNTGFVTTKGEVLTPEGFVIAGKGREILRLKREIRELEQSIKDRQQDILEKEGRIGELTLEIKQKKDELSAKDKDISQIDKELSILRHKLTEDTNDLQKRQRRLDSIDMELMSIASERQELKKQINSLTDEINHLEAQRQELQEQIMAIQKEISQTREEISRQKDAQTSIRLEAASLKERLEALHREKESLQKTIKDIDDNSANLSLRTEQAMISNQNDEKEIQDTTQLISGLITQINNYRKDYDASRDRIQEASEMINELDTKLKDLITGLEAIKSEINAINQGIFQNTLIKENLEKQIKEKYGVDLNDVNTEGEVTEDDYKRLDELQERIREIGAVSLDVIDEYNEVKKSYDFLQNQKDDLEQSIAELQEAITRINNTTKRRLREAYNLLKEKFDEVFKTLFGGGKADLILQDEDNILESGIDIFAQPPGKKNQNLNQLSGGEKALTSLALLFAGFLIKPSPLCILDEADAPLDETNIERFSTMIKNLSKNTQFIIITHNRLTMQIADYIYGVTMEEPGVSKYLALQFSDVENTVN
ncbi:MAG: chromosome segregation protein SMC [Thermodesulfovibrionales bacterium]|nr:chromosome segregation protein SMC [Thermodesulfovibrionales bacterium]